MKLTFRIIALAMVTVLWASVALAAKSVAVLPFKVNGPKSYAYLGQALPSTLSQRLLWPGQVEISGRTTSQPAPSAQAVAQVQKAFNVDYVAWGTVNIVNNTATIEVSMRDRSGKIYKRSAQGSVGNLIGSVQNIANGLSSEAFGRASAAASTPGYRAPQATNQMNPGIVVNETNQQGVYLNPQFRYQGASTEDGSRLRSKALDYTIVDFAIGKFSGSGRTEIAILGDHTLTVYDWNNGNMKVIAQASIGMSNQAFILRKVNTGGRGSQLVVTSFSGNDNRPTSFIYGVSGNSLRVIARTSNYFLNVVPMAPSFRPTLVAQAWDNQRLLRPGVHLANVSGGSISLAGKVSLPKGGNVFNFGYLASNDGGSRMIMYSPEERITVYSPNGERVHQTMDKFSGSSVGMKFYKGMAGIGVDRKKQLPSNFFAPMRLNVLDIEGRGEYVLLINKPISTAAEIFDNYRMFPQGEIHALYWDGVGLGLKWKTRRIRGSVVNSDVGDLNNDGIMDLVVGLNTHPGSVGIGKRRGIITAYPLDVGRANPNTPADVSDFNETGRY